MMKKIIRKLSSRPGTIAMFALSAVLLAVSGIGGVRAALTYFSNNYAAQVEMYDIGVSLLENGERVAWRDYIPRSDGEWDETDTENHVGLLLTKMLGTDENGRKEPLQLGKPYTEELSVRNSGTINEYVRVNLYKYWLDKDGKKLQDLSPDLIGLNLLCDSTGSSNGWLEDKQASTSERTVLYYNRLVYADNEENQAAGRDSVTPIFSDELTIDGGVAAKVHEETNTREADGVTYTEITTTYEYDGVTFQIKAEVDAVQERNAEKAALSAWGRNVRINGGVLTLADPAD